MRFRARTTILCLAFCAGCGHVKEVPIVRPAPPMPELGTGDVFEVRVYGEEDLSGNYQVSSDGSINFPLAGRIEVDGMTAHQVANALSESLKNFIKNPSVSVYVKEYQSKKVMVFGKVAKAGTFPFQDGMSIIEAITLAGGFGDLANKNTAFVTRLIEGQEQRLEVSVKDISEGKTPNFRLEPGDIVFIDESWY